MDGDNKSGETTSNCVTGATLSWLSSWNTVPEYKAVVTSLDLI